MDVTIDDDTGTFLDVNLQSAGPGNNYGAATILWTHLFATTTNEANFLTKIDTSAYSGITIEDAYIGLTESARSGTGYNITLNRVIAGDWIEGTKNGTAASVGEPTWTSRIHNSNPAWNTPGCNGSGIDFQAIAESTTFVGSAGLHTFVISVATMQDMIDNPATNYGYVWWTADAAAGEFEQFYSSEGAGTKPFLSFTFTEGNGDRSVRRLLLLLNRRKKK